MQTTNQASDVSRSTTSGHEAELQDERLLSDDEISALSDDDTPHARTDRPHSIVSELEEPSRPPTPSSEQPILTTKVEAVAQAEVVDVNAAEAPLQAKASGFVASTDRLFKDTWFLEALAIAFATACLAAVVGLLLAYEGKNSLTETPQSISLNTIVSILATAARLSLAFATAALIGQAKWRRFNGQTRPLQDLQDVDSASRGPLGSLLLLMRPSMLSVASLGALVLVLNVAMDPFIQQIIDLRERAYEVSSSEAAVSNAYNFPIYSPEDLLNLRTDLMGAIDSAIYSGASNMTQPSCPSGDCSWPAYRTISWCSQCEDVKSSATERTCTLDFNPLSEYQDLPPLDSPLQRECSVLVGSVNYSFTVEMFTVGGHASLFGFKLPYTTTARLYGLTDDYARGNLTFAGVLSPIVALASYNTSLVWHNDSLTLDVRLENLRHCALNYCVQEKEVSVQNSTMHSRVRQSTFLVPARLDSYDLIAYCWHPEDVALNDLTFTRNGTFLDDEEVFYDEIHFAWCVRPPGRNRDFSFYDDVLGSHLEGYANMSVGVATNTGELVNTTSWQGPDEIESGHFAAYFDRGLEKAMADIAQNLEIMGYRYSNTTIEGTEVVSRTVVHVSWPWIIYPFCVLLLAILFFAATVLDNRRSHTPLWKDSLLALVFNTVKEGLTDDTASGEIQPPRKRTKIESAAESSSLRLLRPGTAPTLVVSRVQRGTVKA